MFLRFFLCVTLFFSLSFASVDFNDGVKFFKNGEFSRAASLFEKACNDNIEEACNNYAVMLATGQGVKIDILKAAELYTKTCELGDGNACYNAGAILINYSEELKNFSDVISLFDKACELGSGEGCYNMAAVYISGIGQNVDMDKAGEYFQKACEMSGNSQACQNSGVVMYEKDAEKSLEYFKKSCDDKNYLGCYNYAVAKIKLASSKEELMSAKEILDYACSHNENLACDASIAIQISIDILDKKNID